MRVFGWRERAALAAGIGAMCLCTLLVSHASQRTTLVADDFAWNRGSFIVGQRTDQLNNHKKVYIKKQVRLVTVREACIPSHLS